MCRGRRPYGASTPHLRFRNPQSAIRDPRAADLPDRSASLQRPVPPPAAGYQRLRRARARARAGAGRRGLGRDLRPGDLCPAAGIKLTGDRGATWAEITDSAGAATAPHVVGRIASQYVLALAAGPDGSLWAAHLRGLARSADGGRTWSEFPEPSPCDPARCFNRIRALAADSGGVWVGTERGLYRLDPTRGLWVDRRGRANCGRGPIIKKCRADIPPVQRLDRAPPRDVYAATPGGLFRYDDPLSICDPVRMATAFLPLSAGWYAVGRPTGLASCRFDQGLTLVGVTYRPPADTSTQGR